MNNTRKITICIGICLLVIGCKQKEQGYAEYINDPKNKITQEITVGKTTATVKWLPLNDQQMTDERSGSKNFVNKANDDFYYFNVKFGTILTEKLSAEKTMYLDFNMQKDFTLLADKDSIAPSICQKIENGISGSYEYILAFEKNEINNPGDFTLIYQDKIFGNGTVIFVYNQSDILKIPKLKEEKYNEVLN